MMPNQQAECLSHSPGRIHGLATQKQKRELQNSLGISEREQAVVKTNTLTGDMRVRLPDWWETRTRKRRDASTVACIQAGQQLSLGVDSSLRIPDNNAFYSLCESVLYVLDIHCVRAECRESRVVDFDRLSLHSNAKGRSRSHLCVVVLQCRGV